MPTPNRVRLRDSNVLDGVHRSADGYLAAYARVARVGTQEYLGSEVGRPDLARVILYRPESEVFSNDAMRSMAHRPVTINHPPEMVDSKNWGKYAVGHSDAEVARDGDCIRVPMVLMDQAAIDAVEKDGVKQLSVGYLTDIDWTAGVTPEGKPFHGIMTNIRGNHHAIVSQARGGPKLKFGDAGFQDTAAMKCADCGKPWIKDAKVCDCGSTNMTDSEPSRDPSRNNNQGSTPMTASVIVDGVTLEVADKVAASVIEKYTGALLAKITDAEKKAKKDDEDMDDAKKANDAAIAALKADVSARDGQIAVLNKQVADSALTPEKIDAIVADRALVIDAAKPMLPSGFVFVGKSTDDIRKAVVTAKLGDAAKTFDSVAFAAAFTALAALKGDGNARLANALGDGAHARESAVDLTDMKAVGRASYADYVKRLGTPPTAVKN